MMSVPDRRVLFIGVSRELANQAAAAVHHHRVDAQVEPELSKLEERCSRQWPDAVVTDVSRVDDAEIVRLFRWMRLAARLPFIAITAPHQLDARLTALEMRAQDHAVDPVSSRELAARLDAVLARRDGAYAFGPRGDLTLDREAHHAIRRGTVVPLTPNEIAILAALIEHSNHVVRKTDLANHIGAHTANAVEAHVSSLRRKLHEIGPPLIHTAHGEGYLFRPVPSEDSRRLQLVADRERILREREEVINRREKILRDLEARTRDLGGSGRIPRE
jgi:two-component system OmpR family response regulator